MTSTSNPAFDTFVQAAIDAGEAKKKTSSRASGGQPRLGLTALIRADVQAHPEDEWAESCARVIRQLPFAAGNEAVDAMLKDDAFEAFATACGQHKPAWYRVRREVANNIDSNNNE